MKFYLFSDNKTTIKKLESLNRLKNHSLTLCPLKELDKSLKNGIDGFVYIDISKTDAAAVKKCFNAVSKRKELKYGIVDPESKITDPASLFHEGASDYVGKLTLVKGIDARRITKVLSFSGISVLKAEDAQKTVDIAGFISSGKDWKQIKLGREYTFGFMFVELDLTYEWKNKSGKIHLSKVSGDFLKFVQKMVEPLTGNIWLWGEFGGIILFPYDGLSLEAILLCYKLILNKTIISIEDFNYSTPVSIRMALDIGNTVYQKRGKTGGIVSDTINFMFHLGKRFLPPGNFYFTQRVLKHVPRGMEPCFKKSGFFEGVETYRMILPED